MILEGIVTSLNEDRSVRVSPMGPIVDPLMTRIVLRPFPTSQTYANVKRSGQGVFHVTDDVEMMARAAVQRIETMPPFLRAEGVDGVILRGVCRWYAFRLARIDQRGERIWMECEVVDSGRLRDFFGFNRAKHAVLEAAILATRVRLLPAEEIRAEFRRLGAIVRKTGGNQETRALDFLVTYVDEALGESSEDG
jgi:uncharacterized protein